MVSNTSVIESHIYRRRVIEKSTKGVNPKNHTTFNPAKSSTNVKTSNTWNITYADGTGSYGYVSTDVVDFGAIKIHKQAVEIATHAKGFNTDVISGLVGLAFDTLISTAKPVKTPLDNMVAQKLIPKPEFGVQLIKGHPRNTGKGGGKYTFGGYDSKAIKGSILYRPVEDFGKFGKLYWSTTVDDIIVNGKSAKTDGKKSKALSIFDTGTTLVYVDDKTAQGIHEHIPGAKYDKANSNWLVPCDIKGPPVYIDIDGHKFGIPITDLASVGTESGAPVPKKGGTCLSGIQGGQAAVPAQNGYPAQPLYYLMGDIFLKNAYLIFNQGGKDANETSTIGFAKRTDVTI